LRGEDRDGNDDAECGADFAVQSEADAAEYEQIQDRVSQIVRERHAANGREVPQTGPPDATGVEQQDDTSQVAERQSENARFFNRRARVYPVRIEAEHMALLKALDGEGGAIPQDGDTNGPGQSATHTGPQFTRSIRPLSSTHVQAEDESGEDLREEKKRDAARDDDLVVEGNVLRRDGAIRSTPEYRQLALLLCSILHGGIG
jgi:hypothetical protein